MSEIEEMLNLSKREFIKRCKQYIDEERGGKLFEVADPGKCPLAIWVAAHNAKCHREMVPLTAVCPDCDNHVVETLSRVTGYLAAVSSWGAAKQQEFKDRQRYEL